MQCKRERWWHSEADPLCRRYHEMKLKHNWDKTISKHSSNDIDRINASSCAAMLYCCLWSHLFSVDLLQYLVLAPISAPLICSWCINHILLTYVHTVRQNASLRQLDKHQNIWRQLGVLKVPQTLSNEQMGRWTEKIRRIWGKGSRRRKRGLDQWLSPNFWYAGVVPL